jgi:hypothetical protein
MLEQTLHASQTIKTTSTQDLDPLPLTNNDHPSVLSHEMYTLESGDPQHRPRAASESAAQARGLFPRPPLFDGWTSSARDRWQGRHIDLGERFPPGDVAPRFGRKSTWGVVFRRGGTNFLKVFKKDFQKKIWDKEPSVYETCTSISFTSYSFITPTLI